MPNGSPVSDNLGDMAQLVEHIVHIDGVTGSSPVATTGKEEVRWWLLLFFFFPGKKEESLYHSQPDEGGMIHEKYCADPAANTAITNVDQEREIL